MQWEYQMIVLGAEAPGLRNLTGGQFDANVLYEQMNKLGREGWELVTGFDTSYIQGATRDIVLLFKRSSLIVATPVEELGPSGKVVR